jgi:hypothetical protein
MLHMGDGHVYYESIKPLSVSITRDADQIICTAKGGMPPYTYTWDKSTSFTTEPMTLHTSASISSTIRIDESALITCTVTDSLHHIVKTQHMVFQ